jgi:WD40 repeat protein
LTGVPLPDGRTLLATGAVGDPAVWLWDPVTAAAVGGPLTGNGGGVWALAASSLPGGGSLLAVCDQSGVVRVWDPIDRTAVGHPLAGARGLAAMAAVVSPDGRILVVTGTDDGTVLVRDPLDGRCVLRIRFASRCLSLCDLGGGRFAVGLSDGVIVLSLSGRTEISTLEEGQGARSRNSAP